MYKNIRLIIICGVLISMASLRADALPLRSELNRGNDMYKNENYSEAQKLYNDILNKHHSDIKARFNLGNALYKDEKYAEGQKMFESLTHEAVPERIRQKAFYNLGNALFEQQEYKSAIKAYETAVQMDTKDQDARFNLGLAKQMLKQPPQKKQNKNDKKKKDDKKDKDKNNKKDQNKQQSNNKNDQEKQRKPGEMSKEDAIRILKALEDKEKHKAQKAGIKNGKNNIRDW